jgi:sigma-B regulation protein RsbU (phosphoserine phosphatase)
MPMPPLKFLTVEDNPRLHVISQIVHLVRDDMPPREALLALQGTLRRVYAQQTCYVEANTTGLPAGSYRLTRVWREDGSEAVPEKSPWNWRGVPVRSGGVIAQILAKKSPCVAQDIQFEPSDPFYAELGRYHSVSAAPGGSGDPDNWVMIFGKDPREFDIEFLENMLLRVGLIGTAMRNLQTLGDLRRANAYIDAEMDRIAAIQRDLLPESAPQIPGLEFAAVSQTFDRAGGDIYDAVEIMTGDWAILIADASGHGPSAAVVAAMLHAILHAYPSTLRPDQKIPSPARAMTYANRQLAAKRIEHSFVTAILAVWHPTTKILTYSRAGHNPAMLRHGGTVTELKQVGNLPLAIFPDTEYEQMDVQLQSQDVVVLYTDGITDAASESGEPFGEDRLREALLKAEGSAGQILSSLMDALAQHSCKTRSRDDQTLLVLRVK